MIKYDLLESGTQSSFIAITYSKYLESKAQDYSRFVQVLDDAISVDLGQELEDVYKDFDDDMSNISQAIIAKSDQLGIDLSELESDSTEYREALEDIIEDDPELQSLISTSFVIEGNDFSTFIRSLTPTVDMAQSEAIDSDHVSFVLTSGPDTIQLYAGYADLVESKVDSLLQEYQLDDQLPVTLHGGYCNLKNLLMAVMSNGNSLADGTANLMLNLTDSQGDPVIPSSISLGYNAESLCSEVKANYASAIAFAGGFYASAKDTISDRIAAFNSYVKDKIDIMKTGISATCTLITDRLTQAKTTAVSFFRDFIQFTGWDKVFTEDDVPLTLDMTDLVQYTGATPVACIDLSTALKAVGSILKTITFAGVALVKALLNWAERGLWVMRKYIQQWFINPFDIEVLDNKSSSALVADFQYQFEDREVISGFVDPYTEGVTAQELIDILSVYKGSFIGSKTIFVEQFSIIKDIWYENNHIHIIVTETMKPRCVNRFAIFDICSNLETKYGYHIYYPDIRQTSEVVPSWLDNDVDYAALYLNNLVYPNRVDWVTDFIDLCSKRADLYCTPENYKIMNDGTVSYNEQSMCMGFSLSAMLNRLFMHYAAYTKEVDITSLHPNLLKISFGATDYDDYWAHYPQRIYIPNEKVVSFNVTNRDFVKSVCGYRKVNDDVSFRSIPISIIKVAVYDDLTSAFVEPEYVDFLEPAEVGLFVGSCFDRYYNPLDYGFLPYTNNSEDYSDPQFKINTDAENAEALNNFLTVAIVVLVAALIIGSSISIVKRLVRANYFRKAGFIGQMDNKMWSGGVLSAKEQRKYVRYSRKLSKSNLLTAGTNLGSDLSSIGSTTDAIASKVDTLYTSITGESKSPLSNFLPSKDASSDNNSQINNVIRLISGNRFSS